MNEEARIDVVVTVVRAVGDTPVEEYSLAVSPKCTVDKINHMLFAEVEWLRDKKDEYTLSLPDGAPFSVYFHRIGEVASIMAIHRAGQKARLLMLPNNQQPPRTHTHPVIPKLSLSGLSPTPGLSLSPRGSPSATSPRSPMMALVGSPRRHSFYPSSLFSLTEAEHSDIWKGSVAAGGGEKSEDENEHGGGWRRTGSGLKRSITKDELSTAAAVAVMERSKQIQEENERLRQRMGALEQQTKEKNEEMEERKREWEKERQELIAALALAKQHQQQQSDCSVEQPEERKQKEKEKERKKSHKRTASGTNHDGQDSEERREKDREKEKKRSKHKMKKAARSLKLSEVKEIMNSPLKSRKGSKTWDDGDKPGLVLREDGLYGALVPESPKKERPKKKTKKEESKGKIESIEKEREKEEKKEKVVGKAPRDENVDKSEDQPTSATAVASSSPAMTRDEEPKSPTPTSNDSLPRKSGGDEGGQSDAGTAKYEEEEEEKKKEREKAKGSFVIVVEGDVRIDEDLLDSGSENGSGVKLRSASRIGRERSEEQKNESDGEGKINEDEVEDNYDSEPEAYDGGGRERKGSVEIYDDADVNGDHNDDDDDGDAVFSEEDSGREEWERGKDASSNRKKTLRFSKTVDPSIRRRQAEKKRRWLREKKERTRTSRWEELLKEQQETLKALQINSYEFAPVTSSEFPLLLTSDLSTRDLSTSTSPAAQSWILGGSAEAPKDSNGAPTGAVTGESNEQTSSSSSAAATTKITTSGTEVPTTSPSVAGGVQAYKAHQARRLWFRRKNTLPRTLEELASEYQAKKKELDERARKWTEKRREKGEALETDERERERERNERKALRLKQFGAHATDSDAAGGGSAAAGEERHDEEKRTRQMRALSVVIKKGDYEGEEAEEKVKKRSESTRRSRKSAQSGSGGSANGSPSMRKSGSMIAGMSPAKDKIALDQDVDIKSGGSIGDRLSPIIARKKAKEKEAKKRRNTTVVAPGSSPEGTSSIAVDSADNDTGSHISTGSTNSGELSPVRTEG